MATSAVTYTAKGKMDKDTLIREYLPIVRRQALALQVRLPSSIELNDLIQAGVVGLLDCVDRFDANMGASFATFASQRIRGAMIDELRSRDWLPRSARRNARAMETCMRRLEQQLGHPPSEREIASALAMSLEEYQQLLNDINSGHLLPLEELMEAGQEVEPSDGRALFEEVSQQQMRHRLIAAIDTLPERERKVLGLYYQEELNLKEIGAVLGVTESRVCQIHSQAVARLRVKLRD
jgi:RNA polymerase sigma factor for flagellar operon FliA